LVVFYYKKIDGKTQFGYQVAINQVAGSNIVLTDVGTPAIISYQKIVLGLFGRNEVTSVVSQLYSNGTNKFYAVPAQYHDNLDFGVQKNLYIVYYDDNGLVYHAAYENGSENSSIPNSITLPSQNTPTPENPKRSSAGILAAFFGTKNVTAELKTKFENDENIFYPQASDWNPDSKSSGKL
jgi:hypothetical protein